MKEPASNSHAKKGDMLREKEMLTMAEVNHAHQEARDARQLFRVADEHRRKERKKPHHLGVYCWLWLMLPFQERRFDTYSYQVPSALLDSRNKDKAEAGVS